MHDYVNRLKELIESKFAIKIPHSWLNPIMLEEFCGYNDLRKEQEEIWRKYLGRKKAKPVLILDDPKNNEIIIDKNKEV